jgi:hypothetical protein
LCRWQGCQIYLNHPLEVIHHIAERHIGTTEEKVGSYHTILESVVKAAQRDQESKNSTRSRNEVSATRNPSHDPHGREPLGRQSLPHRNHNNTPPTHPPTMPRHQPRMSNSSPSFACSWLDCNHVNSSLDKVAVSSLTLLSPHLLTYPVSRGINPRQSSRSSTRPHLLLARMRGHIQNVPRASRPHFHQTLCYIS